MRRTPQPLLKSRGKSKSALLSQPQSRTSGKQLTILRYFEKLTTDIAVSGKEGLDKDKPKMSEENENRANSNGDKNLNSNLALENEESAGSVDKEKLNRSRKIDSTLNTPSPKRAKVTNSENINELGIGITPTLVTNTTQSLTPELKLQQVLTRMSYELPLLDSKMGKTWFTALEKEFRKDYFKKLNDFVISARSRAIVYPPPSNVWEWTKQYPIQDVKVVILGQDPYHGLNQAHGLCFSVKKEIRPPPSLINMYKELESDISGFEFPAHGCLLGWAEQGVLLLNSVLTVEAHRPNSHKDQGWETITDAVIKWISDNLNSVVFLLWGAYAQKKAFMVDKVNQKTVAVPRIRSLTRRRLGRGHFPLSALHQLANRIVGGMEFAVLSTLQFYYRQNDY